MKKQEKKLQWVVKTAIKGSLYDVVQCWNRVGTGTDVEAEGKAGLRVEENHRAGQDSKEGVEDQDCLHEKTGRRKQGKNSMTRKGKGGESQI